MNYNHSVFKYWISYSLFITCVLILSSCEIQSKVNTNSRYHKNTFIRSFEENDKVFKHDIISCGKDTSFTHVFSRKLNNFKTFPLKGKCTFQEIDDNRYIINIGFLPDYCNYLIVDSRKKKYIFTKTPLQKEKTFRGLNFLFEEIIQNSIESNLELLLEDSLLQVNFDFYHERPFLFFHSMFNIKEMGNTEYTVKVCTTCIKNNETLNEIINVEQKFSKKVSQKKLSKLWDESFNED